MKWIYTPDRNNTARYTLGVSGKRTLFCFGINPSTAEPNNLDNTVRSVERIAKRHNFDGWIMLNLYPQRATNPNDMHATLDQKLHKKNLEHIKKLFAGHTPIILAAWGTLINKRDYLPNCLRDIVALSLERSCQWMSIGPSTKDGHPHHPLYLSNSAALAPFDIEKYLRDL